MIPMKATRTIYLGGGQWVHDGQLFEVLPDAAEMLRRAGLAVDAADLDGFDMPAPADEPRRRSRKEK